MHCPGSDESPAKAYGSFPATSDAVLDRIAQVIAESGRYRIVAQFRRRTRYFEANGAETRTALFVDVETTGVDTVHDAIIQLCAVPFRYVPSDGRIVEVEEGLVYLEDPGRPIPAAITALTGITDQEVVGKRINDGRLEGLLRGASLVVAHNADFDRRFIERRLPAFRRKPWACSYREVPWAEEGFGSAKLEWLLFKHCGECFEGHRADEDCYAGIHVLATELPSGRLPFTLLLESCRKRTARIWAVGSAYETRGILKARGYRWSGEEKARPRTWYTDVPEDRAEEEFSWLAETIYDGTRGTWACETYDARDRYSDRV